MKLKALMIAALVAVTAQVAQAATPVEVIQQAEQAYAQREYDNAGVSKAQEAANLFAAAAADKSIDTAGKAVALAGQAESIYFVANVSTDNNVKITKHLEGLNAADAAVKLYGIDDVSSVSDADLARLKALPAAELAVLAKALFQRGINLGQWGAASGVAQSLGKWPELRSNMDLVAKIGFKEIAQYGPYRTLGLGYYKIPALLGGSMSKADKYLSEAVTKTLAAGQVYSVNGYNNVFYAQVLRDNGNAAKAKDLLQNFLKADPNTLNPGSAPETKAAQREAAELLKTL